jgi:rod shape-determining protein MreC
VAERNQKEVWKITPWVMLFLLLSNFVLMAVDAREANSQQRVIRVWSQTVADFIQSPVTFISSGITNYFSSISSMRSAQSENDVLKQKVQELEVEVQNSRSLAAENERLKSLLDLKSELKYNFLPAKIIGRDTSVWFDTSIINRGSLDGVKLNMPVVTNGGLVGRITMVSPLTAQVALITKDKSGLGAVVGALGSSNALGVVTGSGKKEILEMGYVPGSVEVKVGESVYTTGQDGIYPAGLKLGEVVEVQVGSASEALKIFIQPSAKLSSMQEVAVLLYEPPPRPEFEKSLPNAGKKK